MLFSSLVAGLWTVQVFGAPCVVFNKLPSSKSNSVPVAVSSSHAREHTSGQNRQSYPAPIVERRGRGRYQTARNGKVANCTENVNTLSARIPVAESEAGRGIYQTIETGVDGDEEEHHA